MIAVVSHTIAQSSDNNNVTTSGIDTTGATLIVLVVTGFAGIGTVSDSKSNTWTARTKYGTASDAVVQIFYCPSPTVGAGHTFTVSSSGKFPAVAAIALSGADGSTPYDVENGAADSTTPYNAGSVTPSQDNEILIAGYSGYSGAVNSIDSSFTIQDKLTYNTHALTTGLAYKIQTTAGAENPGWSTAANQPSAECIATFKAAAAVTGNSWYYNRLLQGAG